MNKKKNIFISIFCLSGALLFTTLPAPEKLKTGFPPETKMINITKLIEIFPLNYSWKKNETSDMCVRLCSLAFNASVSADNSLALWVKVFISKILLFPPHTPPPTPQENRFWKFYTNCLHWKQFAWNVKSCFQGKNKKNIFDLLSGR